MSNKEKKLKKHRSKTRIWIWVSVASTVLVGVVFGYVSNIVNNKSLNSSGGADREWLYPLWVGTLVAIYTVIAIFKAKGWWKVIPLICLITVLLLVGSSQFKYSFSSFQF